MSSGGPFRMSVDNRDVQPGGRGPRRQIGSVRPEAASWRFNLAAMERAFTFNAVEAASGEAEGDGRCGVRISLWGRPYRRPALTGIC